MNLYFHVIFLDDATYKTQSIQTGLRPRFRPVTPHTSDVEKLVIEIAIACQAWLSKSGYGADDDVSDLEDDGLGLFQAASSTRLRGRVLGGAGRADASGAAGAGNPQQGEALPPMCASCAEYNLHAGVAIGAQDRSGPTDRVVAAGALLLRPPLGLGACPTRLSQEADGSLVFEMKRAYVVGTAALRFKPEGFFASIDKTLETDSGR